MSFILEALLNFFTFFTFVERCYLDENQLSTVLFSLKQHTTKAMAIQEDGERSRKTPQTQKLYKF